jgi:tetratricopeptide (TPR) repeat protein
MLSGCAYAVPEVDPADIPRLRRDVTANPEDTDLQVQLGMAQFKAEDYDQALQNLQAAVDAGNESGVAFLYLGMTHEQSENWSGARDAYSRYLEVGRSDPLKQEITGRLELIGANILRDQARAALAAEAGLGAVEATPQSVAVFPFAFNSERAEYEPLIYALSDMMITDFAVSNALTVLERSQIQTLLDEMALTEAGYSEAATGARAGRLLQAEHVVQGVLTTLGENDISVVADILNIPNAASAGTVDAQDNLQNLFDLEKDLVFRTLRDVLNVQLTPAEEQAIRDNRAENVLAFLAYGRGLRARDRGDYAGANQAFQQAQQLDPSFDAAAQAVTETQTLEQASGIDTNQIQQTATNTGETGGGSTFSPPPSTTAGLGTSVGTTGSTTSSTTGTLNGANNAVNPTPTSSTLDLGSTQQSENQGQQTTGEQRDPVQESQGQEGSTSTAKAQIRIVIKRPGGGA